MAQEKATIARPYAEAVFARAEESGKLDLWSEMLAFLSAVVKTPEVDGLIRNPKLSPEQVQSLMLEVAGGRLDDEGQNLVKLLVHNDRLIVVPEIAVQFEQLKHERQGVLKVQVRSAYAVNAAQQKAIADALKARLDREIEIVSEKDPNLLGGVVIRAGDLVIDGSVRGQLKKLATELRT